MGLSPAIVKSPVTKVTETKFTVLLPVASESRLRAILFITNYVKCLLFEGGC